MQLEAVQDRLHFAHMQRIAASAALPAPAGANRADTEAQAEAQRLRSQLDAAQQQNSALRATAARLSKALAAVMQRSTAGARTGVSKPGSTRPGKHRPGGAAGSTDVKAATEVLAQLAAVEGALAGMTM